MRIYHEEERGLTNPALVCTRDTYWLEVVLTLELVTRRRRLDR